MALRQLGGPAKMLMGWMLALLCHFDLRMSA